MITNTRALPKQSGAALVIGLILLTIITLLSVSAMQNTNLETKIAVNHQFKELSFQAAENALAIIVGPELDTLSLDIPPIIGDTDTTADFYTATGITDQPDLSTDVAMTYQNVIDPGKGQGNVLFSGYQPDVVTHLYLADAFGHVGASGTQTHNRMQVALIRQ